MCQGQSITHLLILLGVAWLCADFVLAYVPPVSLGPILLQR